MDNAKIRQLLYRWGRAIAFCRSKQEELNSFTELLEDARSLPPPSYDGMPRSGTPGKTTERAALKAIILSEKYGAVIEMLSKQIEIETAFLCAVDCVLCDLPSAQRDLVRMRYREGLSWLSIAFKFGYMSDRTPRKIDQQIVNKLDGNITITALHCPGAEKK